MESELEKEIPETTPEKAVLINNFLSPQKVQTLETISVPSEFSIQNDWFINIVNYIEGINLSVDVEEFVF